MTGGRRRASLRARGQQRAIPSGVSVRYVLGDGFDGQEVGELREMYGDSFHELDRAADGRLSERGSLFAQDVADIVW